jgi:quinol monooxygenase YgiN
MMAMFFFGRFQTKAGHNAAFEKLLPGLLEASRAEAGCVSIQVFRSMLDRQLFYIHSEWKDEVAFDFHADQPHTVMFLEQVQPLLERPVETTRTERIA